MLPRWDQQFEAAPLHEEGATAGGGLGAACSSSARSNSRAPWRWAGLAAVGLGAGLALAAVAARGASAPSRAAVREEVELAWVAVRSTGKNPFAGRQFYVNPRKKRRYLNSINSAKSEKVRMNLQIMSETGSANWIDKRNKINGDSLDSVEGILTDAARTFPAPLVAFVWYGLPNRDCDAKASAGEICCTLGDGGLCDYEVRSDCAQGVQTYKDEYVDPFVKVLKQYSSVPVVIVMEPDSLANLATNTGHPRCGNPATVAAYRAGIKYAVDRLTTEVPNVTIYMDAAHGAWLGWGHSIEVYLEILHNMSLPIEKIRGFAINVAKYQPLGARCPWEPDIGYFRNAFCLESSQGDKAKHALHPCCEDRCGLLKAWNSGNNELNYAALLLRGARRRFGVDFRVVIDTGRNGAQNRRDCSNFCNIRSAGGGSLPTSNVSDPDLVDAYFWIKTPGESDGCTQLLPDGKACPRYDGVCGSQDSLGNSDEEPAAPEAGEWYDFEAQQLAELASWTN